MASPYANYDNMYASPIEYIRMFEDNKALINECNYYREKIRRLESQLCKIAAEKSTLQERIKNRDKTIDAVTEEISSMLTTIFKLQSEIASKKLSGTRYVFVNRKEQFKEEGIVMKGNIEAPIGNCHGSPFCKEVDGEFYLCIDDWCCERSVKVSKRFYAAWCDEFKWCQEER